MILQKPIGWYLKEADSLITTAFGRALATLGINRFHWQILKNISTNGHISRIAYHESIQRFMTLSELDNMLAAMAADNRIVANGEEYTLTEEGRKTLAAATTIRETLSIKMMAGTAPEDYQTTLRFLDQLINNLSDRA